MAKIRTRPMEKIFLNMCIKLGVVSDDEHPAPTIRSAIFMARMEMREYIEEAIGKDDYSPAAQRLRAQLRKM